MDRGAGAQAKPVKRDLLLPALVVCAAATLFHHVHNAEFLDQYPNMPVWISPLGVYAAWIAATAAGCSGYWLLRSGRAIAGSALLIAYGGYGLDGLVHYALAPAAAHTLAMNVSIWLEAVSAALLLGVLTLQRREK